MTPELLPYFLNTLLLDETSHFLLSGFAGLLVFLLMSTTFYAFVSALRLLTPVNISSGVDFFILSCCLLLGVCAALYCHYYLDYIAHWYITPLGPSLVRTLCSLI